MILSALGIASWFRVTKDGGTRAPVGGVGGGSPSLHELRVESGESVTIASTSAPTYDTATVEPGGTLTVESGGELTVTR